MTPCRSGSTIARVAPRWHAAVLRRACRPAAVTTTISRLSRRRRLHRPRHRHRVVVPTVLSRSSGRTAAAIECATLEVPADRANPDLGSLELALGRRPRRRRPHRLAAREPGRSGRTRHPDSSRTPRRSSRGAARPLRHRRLGPARHRRQHGDRLRRRSRLLLRQPTTRRTTPRKSQENLDAGARARRRRAKRAAADLLPYLSSSRNRRRHGRDPRRARRRAAQLPRLLLRHVPRCVVRRHVPAIGCGRWCSTVRSTRRSASRSSRATRRSGFDNALRRLPRRLRAQRLRLRRRRSARRVRHA